MAELEQGRWIQKLEFPVWKDIPVRSYPEDYVYHVEGPLGVCVGLVAMGFNEELRKGNSVELPGWIRFVPVEPEQDEEEDGR